MNISQAGWLIRIERVLLALWIGGLWTSGYLVAPLLFATLNDRQLAGQIAGNVFRIMNYIGIGIGSYLLITVLLNSGKRRAKEWRMWSLAVMLLLILIAAFVIQPMMEDLKLQGIAKGTANAAQFGRLHGISSIMFLINSILGLLLFANGVRRFES
jgi:hypothetical protein